jgi:hypothetical protein
MSTIVVDAGLRNKLLAAGATAEIRDESGSLIGRFVADPRALYEIEGPEVTDEELDRRMLEDREYSPEQVMQRLWDLRNAR